MSLIAAGRFGGAGSAMSDGRWAAVLGASVGLHGILLLAMLAMGHRAIAPFVPPVTYELMVEAPAPPLEAAVTTPTPEPIVARAQVVASVEAPVPAAVPVADVATPPAVEVAPPIAASRPAAVVRRTAPVRVAARPAAPERHVAAPSDAPAPVAQAAPAVARAVSASPQWQGALAGWVRSRTRYPEEARQRDEQGAVVISLTVARDGQVVDALLRQRSGSDTLDQAALAMFRAARVPAFPAEMEAAAQITISVPVRYRLEP